MTKLILRGLIAMLTAASKQLFLCMSSLSSLLAKFKKGADRSPPPVAAASTKRTDVIKLLTEFHNDKVSSVDLLRDDDASAAAAGDRCLHLCFIIIDSLPHEYIWRCWLQHGGDQLHSQVKITVHAKYPNAVTSTWVRDRLVPFQLLPAWGSIDLTAVMIKMLHHAVNQDPDKSVAKLCFMSESCVPIYSLEHTLRAALSTPCSWINYSHTHNDGYAFQKQFSPLMDIFPPECVYKADQWMMLNRHDTEALLSATALLSDLLSSCDIKCNSDDVTSVLRTLFKKVSVTDEMYISSMLALFGLISSSHTVCANRSLDNSIIASSADELVGSKIKSRAYGILKRRVTYCDWTKKDRSPETFTEITNALIASARQDGCLFMRKLKLPFIVGSAEDDHKKRRIDAISTGDSELEEMQTRMLGSWISIVLNVSPNTDAYRRLIDSKLRLEMQPLKSEDAEASAAIGDRSTSESTDATTEEATGGATIF